MKIADMTTCERAQFGDGGVVHISWAGPFRTIQAADGQRFRFEMHRYFGPIILNPSNDEPKARQPGPRSPFWHAFELWNKQGRRVTDDGECVWDPAEPERL